MSDYLNDVMAIVGKEVALRVESGERADGNVAAILYAVMQEINGRIGERMLNENQKLVCNDKPLK